MTTYPNDADGAALARLAVRGVDMTKPRLMDFAVAVPDEIVGNEVAKALRQRDYEVEVAYDEGEPDATGHIPDSGEFAPSWTVYVEITIVPEYSRIVQIQTELERIAGPLGGKSDGWETVSD